MAGKPWTAREIAIVSDDSISSIEMAHQTGRTVQAVADYRRNHGISEIRSDNGRSRGTDRTKAATLCPCATLDTEHESWCTLHEPAGTWKP